MAHVLYIDTSPRVEQSYSRILAKEFVDKWSAYNAANTVTHRDLADHPIPYIDATWITAKFTLSEQHTPELANAIQLSDELIDKFLAADNGYVAKNRPLA